RRCAGGDGFAVAGAAPGIRLGLESGPYPRGGRRGDGGPGATAAGWPAGGDAARGQRCGVPGLGRAALHQGDTELLARTVPLLRRRWPAPHQQRPGTVLRPASLSRQTLPWLQGSVPGTGPTRGSTPVGRGSNQAALLHGGGTGGGRPSAAAATARPDGGATAQAGPTLSLPPRPAGLPQRAGGKTTPASFAVLEKKPTCSRSRWSMIHRLSG